MGAEMIGPMFDRRVVIAGGLAAGALPLRVWAHTPPPFDELLQVSPTRSTRLYAWRLADARGIVIFSHGHGSWPLRYAVLANQLNAAGWTVLAPVHVDSMRYPEREKFTMQASFGERIADMTAAAALGEKAQPGIPVVAVGHSFGTLTALCLAGGLGYIGKFRQPAIKAVLGFSTPGRITGLIQPSAYAGVETPVMIVTGTADTVPGFVTDPADHLLAAETAPTSAYAVVLADGGHELVAGTDTRFERALPPVRDFLASYGLGDKAARARLAKWKPATGDRFIVRNAA